MKASKKKLRIFFLVCLAIVVLIGLMLTSVMHGGKINLLKANKNILNVDDSEVGANARISSSMITQRKTGTGPWDADNNPGNDKDEDNNIVRSFDQVSWTIEDIMVLKQGANAEQYKGGVLTIEATVPDNCKGYVTWDLESMSWEENSEVTNDGTVFKAQYSLSKNEVTIPGKQTIVLVLKCLEHQTT